MKPSRICVALLLLSLGAGCRVEERMAWSPDGTRAAVRSAGGLCLMDAGGALSRPLAADVASASWLPDGRGLVLVRQIPVASWQEAVRLLPPEESAAVESLARGMPDVLRGALATGGGDAKAAEEMFFKPLHLDPAEYGLPVLLCLRDTQPAALRQLLQGAKNAGEWEKLLSEPILAKVSELSILELAGGTPRVLERTLREISEARPSPDGRAVAFVRQGALTVAAADAGAARVCVAENVAGSFDWSPDGKALVYAVRPGGKWEENAVNLVRIERRVARDDAGAPAAGDATPLAMAGASFMPRPRWLPDGRILFASLSSQLPGPVAVPAAGFYLIDPVPEGGTAPVAVPVAAGALPVDLGSFAPSPDGRRVAIVEGGSDAVAVLELATGAVEVVSPKRGGKCRTLPVWRNADELYFVALPEAGASRPEWWSWKKGAAPRAVSRAWEAASIEGLIELPAER